MISVEMSTMNSKISSTRGRGTAAAYFSHLALAMITFASNRLASGAARPLRKYFDLSVTEARVLYLTGVGGSIAVSAVVSMIGLDKAAISRAASRLVEKGLLKSQPDPRHLARNLLLITDRGRRYYEAISRYNLAREEALLKVLTPDQRKQFVEALRKILSNIAAANNLNPDVDIEFERIPHGLNRPRIRT